MRFQAGEVAWSFSFWFFAVAALFTLWGRGELLGYLLPPIAVHELGHLAAMGLLRVRIKAVRCTAFGIEIRRDASRLTGYGGEIAICLAGSAANGLAALGLHLLGPSSPQGMLAIAAHLGVALFNLAPIGNLDGGQVAELLAQRFLPPGAAERLSRAASFLMLGLLFGLAFFLLLIRRPNPSLLLICAYLAAGILSRE